MADAHAEKSPRQARLEDGDEDIGTLRERVRDRRAEASEHLAKRGIIHNVVTRPQLWMAHGVDAVATSFSHPVLHFAFGTAVGALRGALAGTLAVAGAVLLAGPAGATLGPVFLAALAVGFIGFTAYGGISYYNRALKRNIETAGAEKAREIARGAGAVPKDFTISPKENAKRRAEAHGEEVSIEDKSTHHTAPNPRETPRIREILERAQAPCNAALSRSPASHALFTDREADRKTSAALAQPTGPGGP